MPRKLWSGPTEACTPGGFITLLWRLRRALETPPLHAGDVIECDRQGALRIAECVQGDNDVEHYRRLIEPPMGKPVERLDATDVDALRRAVALYRGDVLSRLMHVCSLHHDWAEALAHGEAIRHPMQETLQLHQQIADAAVGVAAAAAGPGTPDLPLLPLRAAGAGLQDSAQCIQQARWHLAQADAQLQLLLFPRA